jgi:uncharacterized protein (DUF488 family)
VAATPRVATIGVYGFDLAAFLDALRRADTRLVVDVRQRRGVRGPEYAWANARRLQTALAGAGIDYRHVKALAPTTELRQLQYREDDRRGVGKRNRVELAPGYRDRYVLEILDAFDLGALVDALPTAGTTTFLCVERDPQACHRSLIAARLERDHRLAVSHLLPD